MFIQINQTVRFDSCQETQQLPSCMERSKFIKLVCNLYQSNYILPGCPILPHKLRLHSDKPIKICHEAQTEKLYFPTVKPYKKELSLFFPPNGEKKRKKKTLLKIGNKLLFKTSCHPVANITILKCPMSSSFQNGNVFFWKMAFRVGFSS